MNLSLRLKGFVRRPPVVLASLLVLAIIGFGVVHRLANRFIEQKKALARHLFQQSQTELRKGQSNDAIDDLRSALDYDPNNFDYELNLARALRDTGRTSEAESYLIGLWERDPQNSLVNLAIARLYARQKLVEKSLQYYHNAIFGVWPDDADARRRETQVELIHFLLSANAYAQAQAELISWSSTLPPDPDLQLTVADLFFGAHDYDHSLAEYQNVLRRDHNNAQALVGAGESAYQLGRYRTAQRYLDSPSAKNASNADAKQLLEITNMVLAINPYARQISSHENIARIRHAFAQAGARLLACMQEKRIAPNSTEETGAGKSEANLSPSDILTPLYQQWLALQPKLGRAAVKNDDRDSAMDLTFEIEQKTTTVCGPPAGLDQALLLLSQNPTGAER
jgi:tetratricopeptide (TPR) repeat protein